MLPVGVVGDDESGRSLIKAFRHKHVPVVGVLKSKKLHDCNFWRTQSSPVV